MQQRTVPVPPAERPEHPERFDDVFAEHRVRLEAMARRIIRDDAAAQDVVANAAIRVWRRLQTQPVEDLPGYLARAVRNEALTSLRRRSHDRRLTEALATPQPVVSAEARVDDRDQLDRLLARLSPVQRCTLELRYQAGLSEAQIADALGIPSGTVKSHAHRALRRLRAAALAA